MKMLIINGSVHRDGNTATALAEVEKILNEHDIETVWYHLGSRPVHGCIDCQKCRELRRCVFDDDPCNEIIPLMLEADGVLIGSPVYYAGTSSALCAVLDRVFYAGAQWHQLYKDKVGAALVTRFRTGGCASIDRLNKYFASSQMPIVSTIDYQEYPELKRTGVRKMERLALDSLAENIIDTLQHYANKKEDIPF